MRHSFRLVVVLPTLMLLLLGSAPAVWAGAAEEIAEIGRKRLKAFHEGNLDVFMADVADNAAYTFALSGFRFEGKAAIRAQFEALFRTFPERRTVGRHPAMRVYANDTVVVTNGYSDITLVDRGGHVTRIRLRASSTWLKLDGRWQLVDQHNSAMPNQ